MSDTVTLNKNIMGVVVGGVVLLLIAVAVLFFKKSGAEQDTYTPIDPNTGTAIVRPTGAAPGYELMPRVTNGQVAGTTGTIRRAKPYPGATRGAELMPAPPSKGQ